MENNVSKLIKQRLLLIEKYNSKIEELEILKESLGNDLKRIYQSIPYSKLIYKELEKCFITNDKRQQKELASLLNYYMGNHNFKFDFTKLIDVNFRKAFGIEFTYEKKKYFIQFTNPDNIKPDDFFNGHTWIDDLGISLYSKDKEHSSTLLGSALFDDELRKLIDDKIINRKEK